MIKSLEVYKIIDAVHLKMNGKTVPNEKSYYFKFQRGVKYQKQICSDIASRINSKHYTLNDLRSSVYYHYLKHTELYYSKYAKYKHTIVGKKKEFFSEDSLKRDQKIIFNINKEVKFNGIEEYFDIKENGMCYAAVLILSKYVSPMFYIKYCDIQKHNVSEISEEQKQMNNLVRVIKETTING